MSFERGKQVAGLIFFALVLLGISIYSWYMVFNEEARRKDDRSHWYYRFMKEDEKAMSEGGSLATLVLMGTVSTVFLLFLIFLGIARLFGLA
ncbi:MAG TPA: hypothetical protein VF717_06275 [Pyrinomonadaceae bacterium]